MNTTISVSISDIQDKIIELIKAKFPDLTVESYDPSENLHQLAPAILLDLEELPKGTEVGCGRYPVDARFSLHCILGFEATNLQRQLKEMAIAVSQFIDENGIWYPGGVVTKVSQIEAYPGNFKQDTKGGYDSYVVSWQQSLFIGPSKWIAPEIRDAIRFAVNPADENDAAEFQSLEVSDA